jgi:hypothetical protein
MLYWSDACVLSIVPGSKYFLKVVVEKREKFGSSNYPYLAIVHHWNN